MFFRRRMFGRGMFLRGLIWRRLLFGAFVILVAGGVAYKIHQDDVRRIEQATGKKAENLTEAELKEQMRKLGISKLELTDEEQRQVKEG